MDAVLANSNAVAEELAGEGVASEQLRIVYSGVDAAPYAAIDRLAARRDLAIADDAILFVCVANLIPYKGHRDLLEAFALAAGQMPDTWLLLVVGRDDGIGTQLRGHAQQLGIDENIRWMGERTDVPNILIASDLAVLASHEEGLPKSILEAMAAGLPSVVTGVGGTPEAVLDGTTGKVVEPQNIPALADALVELANDSQMRDQFGRAAKARIGQFFLLETCIAQYEEIYESLLNEFATVSEFGGQGSVRTTEPKNLM
jgi:glycosyltransferase involved in cell wall biosynthesis